MKAWWLGFPRWLNGHTLWFYSDNRVLRRIGHWAFKKVVEQRKLGG